MKISIILVPYDQTNYFQGVGMAPRSLMDAGLIGEMERSGIEVVDLIEVEIPQEGGNHIYTLGKLALEISRYVSEAHNKGSMPVIIGGDCLNAIGVTAGLQQTIGERDIGIAWVDAHGDFNTEETTLSGFLPGMALATICGFALPDLREIITFHKPMNLGHIIMLGTRDLDPAEIKLLDSTPISYLNPAEVDAGSTKVAAGYHFQDLEGVYLHMDIDAVDPSEAPGVDFPISGGISKSNLITAVKEIQAVAPLIAISVASINPALDDVGLTIQTTIDLLKKILKD